MSTAEMKEAIYKKLEVLNDQQIAAVLSVVNKFDEKKESSIPLSSFYAEAKEKYSDVLQKLAQ